jgi:uncharacterized protein (DUF488 family)
LAYVTDMHHGLNLKGIDNVSKIEYAKKHTKKLIWSSSEVKKVHRRAEKDMHKVMSFAVLKERHQDAMVDGV